MKFKFCGDADCPDWVLAVINDLSKISSVKLKVLAQIVAQGIINPPLKMENVDRVLGDSSASSGVDVRACVACIAHIVTTAVRFLRMRGASDVLYTELQQLGLPREHSACLRKILDEHGPAVRDTLAAASLAVNPIQNATVTTDSTLKCCNVTLTVDGREQSLLMTPCTVDVLLDELKIVRTKMVELKNTNYFT